MKIPSLLFCFVLLVPFAFGELEVGFYSSTCPQVESIVQQVVKNKLNNSDDPPTADLLRMHFHDCFVRGCDASILINSTGTNKSEKEAPVNKRLQAFGLIDEVKHSLEKACPLTVSCADIITLATRDAVALSGGPRYEVPTGRRDGLVSDHNEVMMNLPSPNMTVSEASQIFAAKGLTKQEMVTLLGAHTVGVAHCNAFRDRLKNPHDPTMDPALYVDLVNKCKPKLGKDDPSVPLDQGTELVFDNQFYQQIVHRRGILRLDQRIALDNSTMGLVNDYALNRDMFYKSFVNAIIKMGSIQVLSGSDGEVRRDCSVFN